MLLGKYRLRTASILAQDKYKTMKKSAIILSLTSLFSACASSSYIDRGALPGTSYQKSSSFSASRYTGDDDLIVVTRTADNTLVPAACTLTGSGFSANFTGSSRVRLPVFGRSKNAVAVACSFNGVTQSHEAKVENLTQTRIRGYERIVELGCQTSSIGGGNVGVSASIAASAFCNNQLGSANAKLRTLKAVPASQHEYGFTATSDFVF